MEKKMKTIWNSMSTVCFFGMCESSGVCVSLCICHFFTRTATQGLKKIINIFRGKKKSGFPVFLLLFSKHLITTDFV